MPPEEAPATPEDAHALAERLAAPFDPSEVKFKPQAVSGNRALAIPYVDARVVQDRLDDVLGVPNWQDGYTPLPDGSVICRLQVRLGGEWIAREDVGSPSEQPDEGDRLKAAFSDALKRAAVKFGIGRYLYRQKPQWVDYDPQKRQFVRPPTLPASAPPAAPAKPLKPVIVRVGQFEAKLVERGLCCAGDLLAWIGRHYGTTWATAPDADIEAACREFEASCKAARP